MDVLVYNNAANTMERYALGLDSPMPYNRDGTLTVREFRGSSQAHTIWTTTKTMQSYNKLREAWGRPIHVGYAFKRIWEGGHAPQSQHYAGTALDMGQNLTNDQRSALRNLAIQSGQWTYVEPASLTPTWVHVSAQYGTPACPTGGFPLLRQGMRNTYVLVLQDALNALGYPAGALDGVFGQRTRQAVLHYQRASGLSADGIVGCGTWTRLTSAARGIGRTAGVVQP
ncbi:hypothetical protein FACS189415_6380 [Bacteroidia bacterium]|nr:hypothetical protein FACS189415_6380 [Bacteroidia bacterium]